jgi:hypothetical protein
MDFQTLPSIEIIDIVLAGLKSRLDKSQLKVEACRDSHFKNYATAIAIYHLLPSQHPEHLVDALSLSLGREVAAIPQTSAVETILASAIDLHVRAGARIGPNPVSHFLAVAAGHLSPPHAPTMRSSRNLFIKRCGACMSIVAWFLTLTALVSVLALLTDAFLHSRSFPVSDISLRHESQLRLPIISICPTFSAIPLFPRGANHSAANHSALTLPPLFTFTSLRLPGSSSPVLFPHSLDNVEEVAIGRDPAACAASAHASLTPQILNASRSDLSTNAFGDISVACAACLRFGARIPVMLEAGYSRKSVVLHVGVSRLWSACHFNDFEGVSSISNRVTQGFADLLAAKIDDLRNKGYLNDPAAAHDLARATPANASALFHPLAISPETQSASKDLFCNIVFASGIFYPTASSPPPAIRYIWDKSLGFWARVPGSAGPYWDVDRIKPRSCSVNGDGSSTCPIEDDALANANALRIYVQDASTLTNRSSPVDPSTFLHADDSDVSISFSFRRKQRGEGPMGIVATTALTNRVPTNIDSLRQYVMAELDFSFDRHLTEYIGETAIYSTWQYSLDFLNTVSLFTGLSFFSAVVGPSMFYVYHRITRNSADGEA